MSGEVREESPAVRLLSGLPWARWAPYLLFFGFILLAYLTRGILLPFVIGMAVAYLFDPVADRLEAWGLPRWLAAAVIIATFFLAGTAILIALWPLLQRQFIGLAVAVPGTLAELQPFLQRTLEQVGREFGTDIEMAAEGLIADMAKEAFARAGTMLSNFISGGLAFFSLLSLLLISPVVAFYLLRDYDHIVARLDELLPERHKPVLEEQWRRIDEVLSGFVRGQITISLVMALLYAAGWSAVGLNYALVLGILAGFLALIPFVGMVAAALIALLVAYGQFGPDLLQLSLVAGVYVLVQTLDSAVLTPRIMGDRIGLHPVWVLFAVFAGGELAGFVGVLLAVPVAAVIGVLVRFTIERYIVPQAEPLEPAPKPAVPGPASDPASGPAPAAPEEP